MFGRGAEELFSALPALEGLDDAAIRRMLTRAWLEVAEQRQLADDERSAERSADLRRLALALQVHAVVVPEIDRTTVRACAFVAAEALDIAWELTPATDGESTYERVVGALLYLTGGYDANARVMLRKIAVDPTLQPTERYAMESLIALLSGRPIPSSPEAAPPEEYLHERVRAALWRAFGDVIVSFTRWLRDPNATGGGHAATLLAIADELRLAEDDVAVPAHTDIQHLARVAATALEEATERALRSVPAPHDEGPRFTMFLEARCPEQPLLWPAAAEYARHALPGPTKSAIVAVPTGAGKSAVADLAIAHAVGRGWVLYLAPTNALVGQIRRQLRRDHPGTRVREFLGGAEYTTLAGEALDEIAVGQVLVMTPEKCSLALRQAPDAFGQLSLLVFDEAHLLADQHGRGALSELVLAEVLARAGDVRLLLMSALIANPEELARWFEEVEQREVIVVREPWRPTRTLRAVVGIDRTAGRDAAQGPAQRLAALPARRRNVSFEAPLALLAGLRGPWSSRDARDYAVVRIAATTPMNVTRPRDGGDIVIDTDSASVRSTVEALAQLLGDRGEKVMAFLPRSRHDSFAAAIELTGFGEFELDPTVQALVELAAAELGVESLLSPTLAKGVGVHTSALLSEERRASEIAFDQGDVTVLFATGTLAQGLNLPATTVIVGGTDIGYDPERSAAERRMQQRSQLLNAIGRAGRARVASRSLAMVVPNRLPLLDSDTVVDAVLPGAEFLAEEDASTPVTSALDSFLARLQADDLDPEHLWSSAHLAISYLSSDTDGTTPATVLERTWSFHRVAQVDSAEELASAISAVGQRLLEDSNGPAWAGEAARRAGVALPVAARFGRFLLGLAEAAPLPPSLDGWLAALLDAIGELPPPELSLLLRRDAFRSTALSDLWSEETHTRQRGQAALSATLARWLSGDSLADVGGAAHGTGRITSARRGQRDPIPRTIRLVDSGIGFGLTRAAGLLAAVLDVAVERLEIAPPDPSSRTELQRLPVALRFGASGRVPLALLRAGARPRVIAHHLARRLVPALKDLSDEQLQTWATAEIAWVMENLHDFAQDIDELRLLGQFGLARDGR